MSNTDPHAVKAAHVDDWFDIGGVVGVGVADDRIVIDYSGDDPPEGIPDEVDGVEIVFEAVGEFSVETTLDGHIDEADAQHTDAHRPVIGGVSTSMHTGGMGTTGFVLEDDDGTRYLASNNHVLANVNDSDPGDSVYQQARGHGGSVVGELVDYIPLADGVTVDLAWAAITHDDGVAPTIYGIDDPEDPVAVREAAVGDDLVKSGFRTGVTEGTVRQIDASVNVRFDEDTVYRIDECIIADDMSDAGDSGSPVLDTDGNPIGLMFAGSENRSILIAADNIEAESGLDIVYGPPEEDDGGGGGGEEGDEDDDEDEDEDDVGQLRERVAALETDHDELADRVDTLETTLEKAKNILDDAPAVVTRFPPVEDEDDA